MIKSNISSLKDRISKKCLEIGRDPDEITLLAVSKTQPMSAIHEAKKCGIFDFGENKAQEFKIKCDETNKDIKWHFIGHLQSNKAKDVVPKAHLIHSVDSIKLANEINKRASHINKVQNILIEVNTSQEKSKFGVIDFEYIVELAEFCKNSPNLKLKGLMTMAPYTDEEYIIRNSFRSLNNIFIKLNSEGFQLSALSMGMTNDFEIAIEEGSTILRIGSAIFDN